jgi:DNA/RNA endonuclease YhcR with UshA esterase domain
MEKSEKTAIPEQNRPADESICSSCGRFVGALTRCPYCGARVTKRLSVQVFRYAALLVGIVGLGLLYLMVRNKDIPAIRIGDIEPTMNFAYVRVIGSVSGDARIFKEGNRVRSLRFMVDDGSGEISVTAFRSQAEALVAANRVPRRGDRVEVTGSLNMTADGDVVMRLQVPEQLKIVPAEMEATPLAQVTDALVGENILVEGIIHDVVAPPPESKAPWVITIRDGSGEGQITFWRSIYEEIPNKVMLARGNRVRARVTVKTYKEKLQLSLGRGADLEFPDVNAPARLSAGPGAPRNVAEKVEMGDITPDMKGRVVRVRGRVSKVTPPSLPKAPYEVELENGDQKIVFIYWDDVARHLGANTPTPGAEMDVEGIVDVYKEKLQLKVQHSRQIGLVNPLPVQTEPVGEVAPVSSITRAQVGQWRAVRGELGEPKSIKGGVVFPLKDESGTISVVLWDRRVPGSERNALRAGVRATVKGEVGEFRGELQIVPGNARHIQVEQGAKAP